LAALRLGDMRAVLAAMAPKSVHLCITSPPFYSKRRYANADEQQVEWADGWRGALGHEPTPVLFVAHLVECFAAVKRVLRDDGVLVVEIGDSYGAGSRKTDKPQGLQNNDARGRPLDSRVQGFAQTRIGIPERFALAMAADGWRWRDSLIWRHTSAMPESVSGWSWQRCKVKVKSGPMAGIGHPSHLPGGQGELNVPLNENPHRAQWADCPGCPKCAPNGGYVLRRGQWRATVAHSYVYVFSKTAAYYGDGEAVLTVNKGEYIVSSWEERKAAGDMSGNREIEGFDRGSDGRPKTRDMGNPAGANLRSVLDIGPEPFTLELCAACRHVYDRRHYARLAKRDGKRVCSCGSTEWVSHYATFPTKLPELFIRAFTSEAGCCPKCQAPHARMIEAMETNARGYSHHDDAMAFGSRMTGIPTEGYIPGKTIGWRPTCSHGDLAPIPCTVLDCFAGTGSTLVAAQRNGRSYIGIDCSQDYLDMAAARLAETQAALV